MGYKFIQRSSRDSIFKAAATAAVACIVFVVFLPATQNGFLNWDDNRLISENPNIRSINLHFVNWALTYATELWMPMTWFSFALDYSIWGLNPKGFHLTNIILHTLNTILVMILTIKLVGFGGRVEGRKAIIAGIITAVLFGIHPLRVQSVAWATERKDVLYSFFYLLSLYSYLRYSSTESKGSIYYILCLLFFAFSLMSKPMAITLPAVLLILDFYPLERLTLKKIKLVLSEKLPFIILSLAMSMLTIWTHPLKGGLQELDIYPFSVRISLVVQAYIFYLIKMFLPMDLAPYYPHPFSMNVFTFKHIWPFIALSAITIFSIVTIKRNRVFSAIWFFYIATLIPATGIFQGTQVVADRYTYIPSLGPFLFVGLGISIVFERCSKGYKSVIVAILILLSGLLANETIRQINIWHDSVSLWSHEIEIFPDTSPLPYYYRAKSHISSGDYQKAIDDLDKVIKLSPGHGKPFAKAYSNRGSIYYAIANYQKAADDFSKSIEVDPLNPDVYYNRGNAYLAMEDYKSAIKDFNKALEFNPGDTEAGIKLKLAYSKNDLQR